jgi:hypothetical protein
MWRRVNRGNNGASNLNSNNSWNVNSNNCWRPVLNKSISMVMITVIITTLEFYFKRV